MMTPEEFARLWTFSERILYPLAAVEPLKIPQVSKSFLIEAGLPMQYFPAHVSYEACPHLPLLGDVYIETFTIPDECAHFRVLSVSRSTLFEPKEIISIYCLDERSGGRVMEVNCQETLFLNSSVPLFAECLLVYSEYKAWVRERRQARETWGQPFTCEEFDAKSEEIHRKIYNIDPETFKQPQGSGFIWDDILYGFESNVDCSP